ncbi:aminopeptidase P family protein [Williamwhitmania taraxaci]|uniref:Xaa-Pro aminopeptidase n=1 Tax=Williamwhitmania taraxaci TaxID=1640674 RepID=A0A1G6IJE3_9BACT|nr:aminopeptidase P family protein [Williamwhitmania taraxaci]SDC05836.1 Xaa-Pro aminopeptidase [Williamwhitmania taraxaci]
MFSNQTYTRRRNSLIPSIPTGIMLFLGNEESPMNYADNTYHFRQDSSFLYYFGLNTPSLAAIIDIDENRTILFGDELTIDLIVWMGTQPSLREKAHATGITDVRPLSALSDYLRSAQLKNRTIHFLSPYRPENQIKLFKLLGINPDEQPKHTSTQMIRAVVEQRAIKEDQEVMEIEKAANVTVEMHRTAMRFAQPGMRESDIAAMVASVALASNGNLSFPIIATINGQTLHNHNHSNIIKDGDLFLLDAGAETVMGYAGDMSSTFPVGKSFTSRQKDIYQVALDAHTTAVNALKPGVAFRDIHMLACKTIAQGMKDLGLMRGNVDNAVEAGAHAMFFPCGLGHMMGLDVHDMENLGEVYVGYEGKPKSTLFGIKSLRLARPLKPGFVLTIEPGIYFIPALIDLWKGEKRHAEFLNYDKLEEYRNFGGLRNEEDFLITENGHRLLGDPLAKTIEDVENERTFTSKRTLFQQSIH